jgi:hypothetical protein
MDHVNPQSRLTRSSVGTETIGTGNVPPRHSRERTRRKNIGETYNNELLIHYLVFSVQKGLERRARESMFRPP